jgi:nucleotide-binding universal stress UspA family protein
MFEDIVSAARPGEETMLTSIVAGVDASSEGGWAAAHAWHLAREAGGTCWLLHVCPSMELPRTLIPADESLQGLERRVAAEARRNIAEALVGDVPPEALEHLEVRLGKPAVVLAEFAHEHDADLVVVGGKKHHLPGRWFVGSTAHVALQTVHRPLLVTVPPRKSAIDRVLVAIDLSETSGCTLRTAAAFANAVGAHLRVVHIVEPLPYDYGAMIRQPDQYVQWSENELQRLVTDVLGADTPRELLHGRADQGIDQACLGWEADVVVVGSHGKGRFERLLLGSTTRRLLNRLPASLLVVPIGIGDD